MVEIPKFEYIGNNPNPLEKFVQNHEPATNTGVHGANAFRRELKEAIEYCIQEALAKEREVLAQEKRQKRLNKLAARNGI